MHSKVTGGNFIGMEKNKKVLLDIFLIILLGFLCVYSAQKEKSKSFAQIQDKGSIAILEESSQQEAGEASWDKDPEMYQRLDKVLKSAFQEEVKDESISNLAKERAEKWKEDFAPQTSKISGFPEELALKLEEILYHSDATEMEDPESPYQKWIQEMGGDEYLLNLEDLLVLFPKITEFREEIQSAEEACFCLEFTYLDVPPNCHQVFHLSMKEGQDNYIFAWTAAKVIVSVTERSGDTFKCLSEFGTTDDEEGRVVRCGDEFYYISRYYTFNGKDCDGISLCHLTDDWEREMLFIRYQPETFMWEKIYTADESPSAQKKMDAYIEQLKEILLQGNYLGIDGKFKGADLYSGDEIRSEFIMVPALHAGDSGAAYQVDLVNCGMPVYVWKGHDPDRAYSLQVRFYYVDYRTGDRVELENAGIDGYGGDNGMDLIQMWFKEIEGKVYTFRLYYVSGYSYMLNVSLLEKSSVKTVRTYLLSPEKAFIVEGGTFEEVYGR